MTFPTTIGMVIEQRDDALAEAASLRKLVLALLLLLSGCAVNSTCPPPSDPGDDRTPDERGCIVPPDDNTPGFQ